MSYLDPPRFHFFGTCMVTPSTVNNATENYPVNVTYNDNQPSAQNPNSVFWYPEGTAYFTLPGCSVTSAVGAKAAAAGDALVGAQLTVVAWGGPPAADGRISDIDPDMQVRSLLVGVRIAVTLPGASAPALTGTMRPANIIDLWGRGVAGGCMFMSVLEDLAWGDAGGSQLLKDLQNKSKSMLSIKFNLDLCDTNPADPPDQFQNGRIAGTIGPYYDGEGIHVLNARRAWIGSPLVAQTPSTPLFNAPFKIADKILRLDLGNSIPAVPADNAPLLQSPFAEGSAGIVLDPRGANIFIPVYATAADYTTRYTNAAGIFDIDLGANAATIEDKPLAVTYDAAPIAAATPAVVGVEAARIKSGIDHGATHGHVGRPIALAENPDGYFAAMDYVALRLQNGAPSWSDTADANDATEVTADADVPVYCTKFGQPAKTTVDVSITPNQYQWASPDGESPWFINNVPLTAISFEQSVQVVKGVGTARFTAGPLDLSQKEPRRKFVDGQLFTFTFTHTMDLVTPKNPGTIPLTLLVFEDTPVVENPTWTIDIAPIFLQYARLYPFMTKNVVDLSNYAAVVQNAARIRGAINRPRNDPSFMPVTRDLSLRRVGMLNRWFANGCPQ